VLKLGIKQTFARFGTQEDSLLFDGVNEDALIA
jgi:hypothetical protein